MSAGVVGFCVGTGRCGTTFLAEVAGREPEVAASHERLRLAATFHMYCKWNGVPVDPEGFLVDREAAIREDLAGARVSFEASALLSHSIAELAARFDARFLLLVRRPDRTVASFAARGWFVRPVARRDPSLPPSYREGEEPRHFFGRNLPRGADFERWTGLGQIGRLGWFWVARNRAILEQLGALPEDRRRIVRLEDLDYAGYREVARFFGWEAAVSPGIYAEIARGRPNAGPNPPRDPAGWDPVEVAEFEQEVGRLAEALGYEPRIERLLAGADAVRPVSLDVGAVLARLG